MDKLIVSPHPDDAEIALGGSISRWIRDAENVAIAVCTGPGDLSMVHSGEKVPFTQRLKEQDAAAKELGGAAVRYLVLAPASKFDSVPQSDFVSVFDKIFGEYKEVYLPLPSYNRDHSIVWETGLAAFRAGKNEHVTVYAYEQPLGFRHDTPPAFFGKTYLGFDALDLDRKKRSILCHESQIKLRENSAGGPGGVDTWAKMRGLECGLPLAELVYLIRTRA